MLQDRLYILAASYQRFSTWCYDHGVSPKDPHLVFVGPNYPRSVAVGTIGAPYVVVNAAIDTGRKICELHTRQAVELSDSQACALIREWKGAEYERSVLTIQLRRKRRLLAKLQAEIERDQVRLDQLG